MDTPNEVHILANLGDRVLGIRSYPPGSGESDPLVRTSKAALTALVDLDETLGALKVDQPNPVKRGEAAEPAFLRVQAKLADAKRALAAEEAAAQQMRQALELPPSGGSATQEIADDHLRQWVRTLDGDQRAKLFGELGEGKHPEVLVALARFRAPDPTAVQARATYAALARQANPQMVAQIDAAQERVTWSRTLVREVETTLTAALMESGAPVILQ